MTPSDDRRAERRLRHTSAIYLFAQGDPDAFELRTRTTDVSNNGLAFRSRRAFRPGLILWCAVPARGVYTRARVSHCSGRFWRRTVGLQFLACPLPND